MTKKIDLLIHLKDKTEKHKNQSNKLKKRSRWIPILSILLPLVLFVTQVVFDYTKTEKTPALTICNGIIWLISEIVSVKITISLVEGYTLNMDLSVRYGDIVKKIRISRSPDLENLIDFSKIEKDIKELDERSRKLL